MNILVVLADQHNATQLGCAGHPQVQTPNFDRFAASGCRFTHAYTQNTICTPSRTSILSSQYCHNHGYYGLSGPAPLGLPNLFREVKAQGYRTAAFGKLHLPNRPRNWIAGDVDRFGDTYEQPDGLIGDSEYLRYLEENGVRELEDSWHNEWNYGARSISLDARPSLLPYEHTQEMWSAREAMRFMEESGDQPFCIQVAFQRPHHPLLPVQRFWDLYPDDLALPPTVHQSAEHRPPAFQKMWQKYHDMEWDYQDLGPSWEDGARRSWRGTLACVSQIDDVFGQLLDFLDEKGLADDTIVVYSSDHGSYHGIHGLPEKAPGISSEAVCRVPAIWRVPGVSTPGSVCEALVESIDLNPTLLALAGLPPMETADGLDLSPLLRGEAESVRQVAVTENAWSKALRWDDWRLVHYQPEHLDGEDLGELYNLADDPDETCNLYADPEHQAIVEQGRRLLLEWLIRTTRMTTGQPAKRLDDGPSYRGYHEFPIASDGRAPNDAQLRFGGKVNPNYA